MFVGNVEPKTEMEDINIDAKINSGFNSFFFFFFFFFVFCVLCFGWATNWAQSLNRAYGALGRKPA